jgi:hypothetical protein
LSLYRAAHKEAFFEPRAGTLALFERFNEKVKALVSKWWERIEDSRVFASNLEAVKAHHQTLRPGDVTLVGLIAEGGQGMRTANNARFLAYREGTTQARDLEEKATERNAAWLADARIAAAYHRAIEEAGGEAARPTVNRAAWEAAVHKLREQFKPEDLGFGKMSLFRIAPETLIATEADFRFAFDQRKVELLRRWQERPEFDAFWNEPMEIAGRIHTHKSFRLADTITDEDFCRLCQNLQIWVVRENKARRRETRVSREAIGLRSSEDYRDPADGPRIATIYNGLSGRAQFVPFRKGDPEGSRWLDNQPLYCEWTTASVDWLSSSPLARWQGHTFFLTAGMTWTAVANHVALKARYQEPCVFDADSMRLTPLRGTISAEAFLALLNSDVLSYFKMRFVQHTQKWEIGNLRQLPIVMPTSKQHTRLKALANLCIEAKRAEFGNWPPSNTLVARTRDFAKELREHAPDYLRPSAQELLLDTPAPASPSWKTR